MTQRKKAAEEESIISLISKFKTLSKESKIELISFLAGELKKQHLNEQKLGIITKSIPQKKDNVPVGIFGNELSSLEAIVKYLREESRLKFSKIAKLTNRSSKTIWATYQKAIKKLPSPFGAVSREIMIPVSAFSDRSFSTLESVVRFIKDLGYSNHEVARMLRLDDRTIWTVYDRVKKKRGMKP